MNSMACVRVPEECRIKYTPFLVGQVIRILCLLFILQPSSFAQIGSWQTHVSYRTGRSVAVVGTKVYAATQNGFFYYDKNTGETVAIGKQQGLSDVGISRLLYLADQSQLLIAYRNGNLDFLTLTNTGEPGTVSNLNTIAISTSLPTSRTINHINRLGNNVYLSTDFGLVVLDVVKREIRDTYFSQRGTKFESRIYQTAIANDSLYALAGPPTPNNTGSKLQAVRFASTVNLADPANWHDLSVPDTLIQSIVSDQGRLFAGINGKGIYERQAGQWQLVQPSDSPFVQQFPATPSSSQSGLILVTNQGVTLPGGDTFTGPLLSDYPREVVADGTSVWVADRTNGLLIGSTGAFQRIVPEGPTQDQFAGLYTYADHLVALPPGPQDTTMLTKNQPPAELFAVPTERWSSDLMPGLPYGFNSAVYLSAEQRLYLGSFGEGLWSQLEEQVPTAVALPTAVSSSINSLATDSDGNLWIATGEKKNRQATLHVRRADGQFQSFTNISQTNIVQILPDDNGFLWLRPSLGGGLIVFDPQTNRRRSLTTTSGQGGLLSTTIRALTKDRNGAIWVGTDLGPTVFDYPASAFDISIDAQAPLLNRRRLLANEVVTAIAVDGGNRKWIGTRTGLYHVAPDGSQLLDTFTADNSPLPTNTIQTLAIDPTSGQVYIETINGLISYRSSATEPAPTLSNLAIFPNPVRPDFTGSVGINGLTDNTTVKIMDAGGQLVYETRSQGGTATWNLRDYRGRQAQTGIYLVVIVSADGLEGLAGKLAVVR